MVNIIDSYYCTSTSYCAVNHAHCLTFRTCTLLPSLTCLSALAAAVLNELKIVSIETYP